MNPNDYSNMLMGISAILTVSFSAVFVYGGFKFVNAWSAKKKNQQPVSGAGYDADAISRLQASVDAISLEVERISEGQRFTTRLMNERIPEQALLPQSSDKVSGVSQ
jgi:hypothetical protein